VLFNILQQLEVLMLAGLFSILFMYQNNRKAKKRERKEDLK